MSTFSGFIYDLMDLLKMKNYREFLCFSMISVFLGVFAAGLGFTLANA